MDLTGTKQKFKSNNQYSDCKDVEAGVIQEIVTGTNTVYHLQTDKNYYMQPKFQLTKYVDE
jgi:hypothetical protein